MLRDAGTVQWSVAATVLGWVLWEGEEGQATSSLSLPVRQEAVRRRSSPWGGVVVTQCRGEDRVVWLLRGRVRSARGRLLWHGGGGGGVCG